MARNCKFDNHWNGGIISFFLQTERANHSLLNSHITRDTCVDHRVAQLLEEKYIGISGHINYRKHPGMMRRSQSPLPAKLVNAIRLLLEKYPVTSLVTKTSKLVRYLNHRQPPLDTAELSQRAKDIEAKIFAEEGDKFAKLSSVELEDVLEAHRKNILSKLRKTVYHWKPMQYDAYTSFIYLLGRMAPDFSISKRDSDFRPTSVFHHGSKVGAGIWASNNIWSTIGEHYCVDECMHMNTIARLLLQDGNEQERVMAIKGVHFRNFSPSPKQNKFSLVVCAYNLMEQPSHEDRSQLVQDLWEMTESYLVLIEIGTGAGFKLVDEAKETLLQISNQVNPENPLHGHVFSPCPHDKPCPKLKEKNQPCLMECSMRNVDFTKKNTSETPKSFQRYSYVIMKKGPRAGEDTAWPRVLQRVKAQKHTHCHLCLPCGKLQHVIISKAKYEKHLYSCARYVDQGDFLPVSLISDPDADSPAEAHSHSLETDMQNQQDSGQSEDSSSRTKCFDGDNSYTLTADIDGDPLRIGPKSNETILAPFSVK
ncbi:methyltransferase-like protein 17, mitochondrial [Plakobranchus ocellatus]|uniref:Methyltransferase-like protein 17, mitochondrial n=1 Tax=Plakobranchus ocellatus TaxID=259542 RepID=A0AAV3ZD36_9GAST|nr:methyltransferase-like protein 17, mitochondrial [Plakobranchus ocellatus]